VEELADADSVEGEKCGQRGGGGLGRVEVHAQHIEVDRSGVGAWGCGACKRAVGLTKASFRGLRIRKIERSPWRVV
jgi:hypothetical protein